MIRKNVQQFSEKHALGFDPRDHAPSRIQGAMAIQPDPIAL
jgi:hypothetical protein